MTEAQLTLSDQVEGYPHPKLTETLYGHEAQEKEFSSRIEVVNGHQSIDDLANDIFSVVKAKLL